MMPAGHHSDSDYTLLPLPKSAVTWLGGIFARSSLWLLDYETSCRICLPYVAIIYLSDNIEMIQKRPVRAIFPGMSYIDLSTLKERRDYICKKYFINNMQASSHKVNCLLPEKGRLTMICDGVICTNYRLLEQTDTGIH